MRLRATLCLSVFFLGLAPPVRGQAAGEFRDRPHDDRGWPTQAVRASHGMIATDEQLGSEAGVEILKRGGNAVDAAVAVALALAVVEPAAGNIGGGGFMLVRLAGGKTTFLDYREVAPGKATRDMYIGKDGKLDEEASVIGYRSVAVPGTVAGLALALKTCGSMKLAEVMAPAILLAENGFPISERLAHEFEQERMDLQRFASSRHIFLNDGKMFQPGETLRQPELAATLKRIARKGATEFYSGQTARMLVDDMSPLDGLITLDDLSKYQPKIREVLQAKYESNGHAWEVLTSPPPSSGGVAIIEALNMLQSVPPISPTRIIQMSPSLASLIPATPRKSPLPSILSALPPAKSSKPEILTTAAWPQIAQQSRRGLSALAKARTPPIFPSSMPPATPSPAPTRSTIAMALMPPAPQVFS